MKRYGVLVKCIAYHGNLVLLTSYTQLLSSAGKTTGNRAKGSQGPKMQTYEAARSDSTRPGYPFQSSDS
jgi:hypothetical protein